MTTPISSDHIWFRIIVAINRITGWKLGQSLVLYYNLGFRALHCNLSEKFMRVLYWYFEFFADHGMPILRLGRMMLLVVRRQKLNGLVEKVCLYACPLKWKYFRPPILWYSDANGWDKLLGNTAFVHPVFYPVWYIMAFRGAHSLSR